MIISDGPISDPQVRKADILVALAEEALPRDIDLVKSGGLVIVDSDRTQALRRATTKSFGFPRRVLPKRKWAIRL